MNGEPIWHAALARAGPGDRAPRPRGVGGARVVVLDPVSHRGAGIPERLRGGRSAPAHREPQRLACRRARRGATRC